MKNGSIIFWIILIQILIVSTLLAQARLYQGPDDAAGDIAAQREGFMSGNRVFIKFQNNILMCFINCGCAAVKIISNK